MNVRPRLLKLSGEALGAPADIFDLDTVDRVCTELVRGTANGPVAVVVGGGNIIRGAELKARSTDPTRGDYMGMLATLINALALRNGIERAGGAAAVVGPHQIPNVCHQYRRDEVMAWLAAGTIVVFRSSPPTPPPPCAPPRSAPANC